MKHHAYVYIGDPKLVLPQELVTPGVDVEHIEVERFSIADARALKHTAQRRPQQSDWLQIVVKTQVIPVEAQNALLKLLEEPPASTVLHVCIPQRDQLLKTVLSRVEVVTVSSDTTSDTEQTAFDVFMAAQYKDRLEMIATAHKNKDTHFFSMLSDGAVTYLESIAEKNTELLRTVLYVAKEMRTPGASKKMLAEELALTLPYQP